MPNPPSILNNLGTFLAFFVTLHYIQVTYKIHGPPICLSELKTQIRCLDQNLFVLCHLYFHCYCIIVIVNSSCSPPELLEQFKKNWHFKEFLFEGNSSLLKCMAITLRNGRQWISYKEFFGCLWNFHWTKYPHFV